MPSSLSFARTNSRLLELPFLAISNFDGASPVKVESGIKRLFVQGILSNERSSVVALLKPIAKYD